MFDLDEMINFIRRLLLGELGGQSLVQPQYIPVEKHERERLRE